MTYCWKILFIRIYTWFFSIYLCICLFVSSTIYLSIFLRRCMSLPVYLYRAIYLFYLLSYLSIYLSINLPINLCSYHYACLLTIYLSIYPSIALSICRFGDINGSQNLRSNYFILFSWRGENEANVDKIHWNENGIVIFATANI